MGKEGADDLVVVQAAVRLGVVTHHAFGGLHGGFCSAVALRVVSGGQALSDAPRFQERPCLACGEFGAAVTGQLYRNAFSVEEGAEARDKPLGASRRRAVYVDPAR